MTQLEVFGVYHGSDGAETARLYSKLMAVGVMGDIALNLFRAQKCSERAKVYRGGNGRGSYKSQAYDRKGWSMAELAKLLERNAEALGIRWGWKQDAGTLFGQGASWVLYVDAPTGQCSFHSPSRGAGPEYSGEWDGRRGMTVQRVIDLAVRVLRSGDLAQMNGMNGMEASA